MNVYLPCMRALMCISRAQVAHAPDEDSVKRKGKKSRRF